MTQMCGQNFPRTVRVDGSALSANTISTTDTCLADSSFSPLESVALLTSRAT